MTHLQNIERNFTFTRKRTDNEERNEIGVSLSDSNEELGNKCFFDRNLIDYWHNSQNICMSFTKYVEFVEKYNQPAEQA